MVFRFKPVGPRLETTDDGLVDFEGTFQTRSGHCRILFVELDHIAKFNNLIITYVPVAHVYLLGGTTGVRLELVWM